MTTDPYKRLTEACRKPSSLANSEASCGDPVDALAEFGTVLAPKSTRRLSAAEACASYVRLSSQTEMSRRSQRRRCRKAAAVDGSSIASDLEFADQAGSEAKLNLAGLKAMLASAEAGQFNVLYFDSLDRLGRASTAILDILHKLVHDLKTRAISVADGLDLNRQDREPEVPPQR
jgi:hypothetical protein